MPETLDDRWETRDRPVLVEVSRRLDAGEPAVMEDELAESMSLSLSAVQQAGIALVPAYLDGNISKYIGGNVHVMFTGITERGRREVGLWPNQEQAADALVDLLSRAADLTNDEDDAGALRKAGRLLRGVPSAVLADVTAALIRQQTGL
jgi:hypothetical protein